MRGICASTRQTMRESFTRTQQSFEFHTIELHIELHTIRSVPFRFRALAARHTPTGPRGEASVGGAHFLSDLLHTKMQERIFQHVEMCQWSMSHVSMVHVACVSLYDGRRNKVKLIYPSSMRSIYNILETRDLARRERTYRPGAEGETREPSRGARYFCGPLRGGGPRPRRNPEGGQGPS